MSNTYQGAPVATVPQSNTLLHWILRAAYFLLFGLWFSGIWAALAWLLCVTIIGLPLGLWMLNRMGQIATLAPVRQELVMTPGGYVLARDAEQAPFLLRALYFLLIGWWFSALWLALAWALSASIIGLPIAFWMINRVPGVITLAR
jgi:uncharacterized membrane protein YccF (DUF307 family)